MKMKYNKYEEPTLPPVGVEVIAFNHKWINEDFNPKGTRVGFRTSNGDFISAYWWDYQDSYITIADWICRDNPEFSEELANSIIPEYWIEIPDIEQI